MRMQHVDYRCEYCGAQYLSDEPEACLGCKGTRFSVLITHVSTDGGIESRWVEETSHIHRKLKVLQAMAKTFNKE